ncbi:3-hydroxyacyl-CoA dehydrogenase NAD-binding domain-containing protein [Amycolatopsis taiwanensis]|uniref:3-hydroxyacyl-CoA dehydrogenase NAD binding domain-containing protein n=1 Tax=Amycolatopsis taiwanensis TaxID=342230 RepID=A0A9W6R6W2_9PSEU|nr:3-hydroxyacyl-CoA dehydrogenase NAD-binding domain-containing protein [Amycolatopsis taiwanensis]GLY70511.1 hypothetical protein Atai01_71300 [Amycolatopsis taiwanensis]
MAYHLPSDLDDRPVTIDGAGTLGRRIATVFAAGGTDVRIFDLVAEQRAAARDYAAAHTEQFKHTLGVDAPRTGRVEASDDLAAAVTDAWRRAETQP